MPSSLLAPGSLTRRELVALALALPWLARQEERRIQRTPAGEPHFVDPPGAMPSELGARVEALAAELSAGADIDPILGDPASNALRPYPSFRELVARHAPCGRVRLVPRDEPGTALTIALRVLRPGGEPYPDVRVYAYQTSAKGWYAAEAPHVSGNSGDQRFARLFAHARTDAEGRLELVTIHPAGYPRSTLPSHVHVELRGSAGETRVTEVRFEDCPRMNPEVREESLRSGFVVVPVESGAEGARCAAELRMPA